ncbi:Cell division protein FtsX [hydrothermal vent metagenome]|uniref:Cell division protein FtsX n=1 Tax=hydrothermal vent metagenome TaxID=652676 RepID=A0A3B0UI53_9ZZZZ
MARQKPRKLKKRIVTSYLTSTISITLVLFLLGILTLVLINAGRLSNYVKEKIGFTLVLHDNIKEVEIIRLQKILNTTEFVKSTRYVDKEAAARELQEELGEDFTGFLGFNPLFSSIDIKLYARYTHPDSLVILEKNLMEYPQVKEVYYQRNLVTVINENVRKISLFLLVFSGMLALIFIALINNTIRISIYSQRFVINTMQLVGATRMFIRRPFVNRSLFYGALGAIIAFVLIGSMVFSYKQELKGIISPEDVRMMGAVFIVILGLGLIISWVSTFLAVNKFLKMKFDELFY